jgi:hypothetical protein
MFRTTRAVALTVIPLSLAAFALSANAGGIRCPGCGFNSTSLYGMQAQHTYVIELICAKNERR